MFERAVARAAWALVLVAMVLALGMAVARYRLERADHSVEVVVDGRATQAWAAQQGIAYVQLLKTLKQNGATAIAVAEQDLGSLRAAGVATVATGAELRRQAALGTLPPAVMEQLVSGAVVDGYTYVQTGRSDAGTTLLARLGRDHVRELTPGFWEIAYAQDRVAQFTLGFDPTDFQAVREAGLRPVPRPANYPGITAHQVADTFAILDRVAPETRAIIFQGNEVLGFPGAVESTADALRARGWLPGLVEKAQGAGYIVQQGQERLTELVGYRVARVSTEGATAAERGVRILYVKPGADPVADVRQAAGSLVGLGFLPGSPRGFEYLHTGRVYQAVLSLGVTGAAILSLLGLFRLRGPALGVWSLALVGAAVLWPFAGAPRAAGWAGSGAIAAYATLAVAVITLQAEDPATPGPRGLVTGWFLLTGLAGGILAQSITNAPTILLGMAPPPPPWLTLGLAFALAGVGCAWAQRRRFTWDARVTLGHLVTAVMIVLAGALAVRYPAWGAILLAGAAFAELPGLPRIFGLAAGLGGAVALALSPAGHARAALLGVGAGLIIQLFLTFRSSAALVNARPTGEGRPYHG